MTDPTSRTSSLIDYMTMAVRLIQDGQTSQTAALIKKHSVSGLSLSTKSKVQTDTEMSSNHQKFHDLDDKISSALSGKMKYLVEGITRRVRENLPPIANSEFSLRAFDFSGQAKTPPSPLSDQGGHVDDVSYAGSTGERSCRVFVPSVVSKPAMLLVMLHGCTQSPDDFAAGTGMNAFAEKEGFFVAYPAQTARANQQKCWNWFEPGDQGRGNGEAEIIAGLTRLIMDRYPVDRMRVYIAGFSAGGAAAVNIARAYPDLYAAVGIHSGLAAGCARDLPSALSAMRSGAPGAQLKATPPRVPTIVIHGDGDLTVNVRNGQQILAQAGIEDLTCVSESMASGIKRNGTRTLYADETGRVMVESLAVDGLGHAWSGGRPNGSYTDASGPDASQAMLDFFKRHALAAGRG